MSAPVRVCNRVYGLAHEAFKLLMLVPVWVNTRVYDLAHAPLTS